MKAPDVAAVPEWLPAPGDEHVGDHPEAEHVGGGAGAVLGALLVLTPGYLGSHEAHRAAEANLEINQIKSRTAKAYLGQLSSI